MLYSDSSGHCSYCQGQEPPLHTAGLLPLQLLGNHPVLLLKGAKQVDCQEHELAARCRGAGPACLAVGGVRWRVPCWKAQRTRGSTVAFLDIVGRL